MDFAAWQSSKAVAKDETLMPTTGRATSYKKFLGQVATYPVAPSSHGGGTLSVKGSGQQDDDERTIKKNRMQMLKNNVFTKEDARPAKFQALNKDIYMGNSKVGGIINHKNQMGSAKVGTKVVTKIGGGGYGGKVIFDRNNPEDNLTVNGGPIPFTEAKKVVKKEVVEVHKGPVIEESSWAVDGDGVNAAEAEKEKVPDVRPKKLKEASQKSLRASLKRGDTNPAARLRAELENTAQMAEYRKAQGKQQDQNKDKLDAGALANYGAVESRRNKDGGSKVLLEEEAERILKELEERRKEEMKIIMEKESLNKEKQLVQRRLGSTPNAEKPKIKLKRLLLWSLQQTRNVFRAKARIAEPVKPLPWIWLASNETAFNKEKLISLGITHILNCDAEAENAFPEYFVYCHIKIFNQDDQEMDGVLVHALKFMNRVDTVKGRLLIHCSDGCSRAATMMMAYMVKFEDVFLVDAYCYVDALKGWKLDLAEKFLLELAVLELECMGVTSVHYHKKWKFRLYEKFKAGLPMSENELEMGVANDDGTYGQPLKRQPHVQGETYLAVRKRWGVKKQPGCWDRLFNRVADAVLEAHKKQMALDLEKLKRAKAKESLGKKPGSVAPS